MTERPTSETRASITFSCPNCGAEGYDVEFTADEMKRGTMVEFGCDECSMRLIVDADVTIQAVPARESAEVAR